MTITSSTESLDYKLVPNTAILTLYLHALKQTLSFDFIIKTEAKYAVVILLMKASEQWKTEFALDLFLVSNLNW